MNFGKLDSVLSHISPLLNYDPVQKQHLDENLARNLVYLKKSQDVYIFGSLLKTPKFREEMRITSNIVFGILMLTLCIGMMVQQAALPTSHHTQYCYCSSYRTLKCHNKEWRWMSTHV